MPKGWPFSGAWVHTAGSTSTFFGVPGAETCALPLKTLEQAIALRNRILGCFERAAQEEDSLVRRCLLTFVIVGGGSFSGFPAWALWTIVLTLP